MNKQKLYALALILGASILFFRTIRLLTIENGWNTLAYWVIVLTFIEMAIDILCFIFSSHWLFRNSNSSKSMALHLGAYAAIFHAFRVLIFVLGRTGPWINFDVKPEFRSTHNVSMFWIYFAAILSILGILGVIIIWLYIKKKNKWKSK
ncbi:hypothetical protein GCM10023314_12480 [Algibacter agarivorans]|uniref:Uncharacterized protein n=1 Tax=Algibacter agarivorans TaxID=1109741 RepID=A0ABP9GJ24_9FLAO